MITFTGTAGATALISTDLMKQVLDITSNDKNTLLDRYIAAACLDMARYCGRDVTWQFLTGAATETWYRQTHPAGPLWPSHWPVTTLTSVTEDGTLLTASDYELDGQRRLWRMDGNGNRSRWTACKIVVAYTGGYALPASCPADLAQMCIDLVTRAWSAKGRDPILKAQSIPGLVSQDYALPGVAGGLDGSIPADIAGKLNSYRNFSFG